jgi:uncharacterized membrane protein
MKGSHSWLMVLCVVGMGAFLVLPALGVGLGSVLPFLLILLCPLSHILMMRRGQGCGDGHGSEASTPERTPDRVTATHAALPEYKEQQEV